MEGSSTIGQRRLIRDCVFDRYSASLLAKAFEQITADRAPQSVDESSVQTARVTQPQPQLLETCK